MVEVMGVVRWISEDPASPGMGVQFFDEVPSGLGDLLPGSNS